jgi:hypothetical protein
LPNASHVTGELGLVRLRDALAILLVTEAKNQERLHAASVR